MYTLFFISICVALALNFPLWSKAGAVKEKVFSLAPEYGQAVFQPSRAWVIVTNSRVRFSVLLRKPPKTVEHLMSPIRRLAAVQMVCLVVAAGVLLAV